MRPDEAILTLWQNLLMKMVWNNYFSRDLSWRDCLQLKSQIQKPLAHDVVVVQLLSCVQLFVTPWLYSTPGFPVLHYLPVFTQIYVHWISDVIRPSHPLSPPSPFAFNLSQHQGLFQWVGSSHEVAKVLELQFQHQSFQWIFRVDLL